MSALELRFDTVQEAVEYLNEKLRRVGINERLDVTDVYLYADGGLGITSPKAARLYCAAADGKLVTEARDRQAEFVKHDQGKPDFGPWLDMASGMLRNGLSVETFDEIVKVLDHGARKYSPANWKRGTRERYYAAALRHIMALRSGETHDPESGLRHEAHALCCLLFIAEIV